MKINQKELENILVLQKQVEDYKQKLIGQINFYELPFVWYRQTLSTELTKDGINILYELEDGDNTLISKLIPWKYFKNKENYIQFLNKEWEKQVNEQAKQTANERLKKAEEELRLAKVYKETFGDI